MKIQSSSGQILVLVLLVVLVGMTIGLSVASRTLTTLRNQAELTESNRAFSAAEAGIERALLVLKTNPDGCDNNACKPDIVGAETNVEVLDIGGSGSEGRAYGVASMAKDEVLQLNLQGYAYNDSIDILWGNTSDRANCSTSAALVLTLVYMRGGQYGVAKLPLDACKNDSNNVSRLNNGFNSVINNNASTVTLQDGSQMSDLAYVRTLNFAEQTANHTRLQPGDTPISLRAKLMYAGQKPIVFRPRPGRSLPAQGQQITSTSIVGGQQRTVKVLRSNDTMPAIFDYALFNGSTSSLTK